MKKQALDFRSLWARIGLTSIVTVNWLLLEWAKFAGKENFYPYSPLEDRAVNLAVLLAGQVLSIQGMKYLSFAPLRRS